MSFTSRHGEERSDVAIQIQSKTSHTESPRFARDYDKVHFATTNRLAFSS
jgi:hypothetical protein